MKNALLLMLLTTVLAACTDSAATSPIPDLPYVELARGTYTETGVSTKKQTKVISSQADYAAELANYTGAAPLAVDFTRGKVLLADMGVRSTGGYSVAVTRAYEDGDAAHAFIVLTLPGAGCAVAQAATNPYQFVFIPSHKEILISERMQRSAC